MQKESLELYDIHNRNMVENYVGHVRNLMEARDALATEFERENEQLRMEFTQLQLEQESQQKEVEEMLEQEGLCDIARSSPSEQVAYFLVERSTLLEKIDLLEQKLQSPSCLESLCAAQPQFHTEELARESALRKHAEQDLDEVARRLQRAHSKIRRLMEEMDGQKKEQNKLEMSELQKARELNIRLDKEILALRNRVRFLDSERKKFLGRVVKLDEEIPEYQMTEEEPRDLLTGINKTEELEGCLLQDKKGMGKAEETNILDEATSDRANNLHQRCRRAVEGLECQNSQLLHKLRKLEQEHEDLVERNAGLESLLGELQDQTQVERERCGCEVDRLQRQISCLEAELCKVQKTELGMVDEEMTKETADSQEMHRSQQEKVAELESKLLEETEWRKQLACDLEMTQDTLKDRKKELHNSKLELLQLNSELQRLWGAAEERDFLHVTHEKLQQENVLLEKKHPPTERLDQKEELLQLQQDVQRVQNMCDSTEKELRHEREKTLELEKHNIFLRQQNVKVKAELRQTQLKLSDFSKACLGLTSQWELSQQKVKEMELELLRQSQASKQQSNLREKLAQEKAKVSEAEKRILVLQQKLKESHHRVRLSETHILMRKQLGEDLKEARESETKAQRQVQEEQWKRKLLDQQTEELQQQLRHSHEEEMRLVRTFAELQLLCQHQGVQLQVLEEEKKTRSDEHLQWQKYSQKVSEQLLALQQEKETLLEEYERILKEVAISVRKQKERQLRQKAKLQRVKETFICEVKQRDAHIRQLENDIKLSKSQSDKDCMLITQMTTENEALLQEKRKFLQQLRKLEEAERNSKHDLSTIQSRVQLLDEENKKLQEWIFQLTGQVGVLERALRSVHSHSLEELKSISFSECRQQSKVLPISSLSFSVMGLSDSCGLLKVVQDGKSKDPAERSLLPSLPFRPSEINYLNLASPGNTLDLCKEEQS
ncbi:coiled-coil domain-containing protein 30 isoform X2 [Rhineura floridana]|uniref:coiled-coil domain-containing protein 30 isoform X2 n=1 Tax=Rhineura floridana TaxID=261503 RepID=UPI002AC7FB9D|nr:coiled-coil domain-containing protein 30 isoform X2 [Rhineura floridana]